MRAFIATLCAVLCLALPALASAERIYFLVGTRHVYRIGPDRNYHWRERQEIEQDYADKVANFQNEYNVRLANGADPAVESDLLNQGLDDAARDRDSRLSEFFVLADDIRENHPELQIEGDGPYQVMGINFHRNLNVMVFDNYCVYAPWPGYVVVDRPYGWSFGVVYTPALFTSVYVGWHQNYVSWGRPAFFGFVGHAGIEIHASIGFGAYVGGGGGARVFVPMLRGPRGSYRPAPAGYRPPVPAGWRPSGNSLYGHPAPRGVNPFVGRPTAGGMNSRTPAIRRQPGTTFGRPAGASARPTGSFGRSSDMAPRRPSGSFGKTPSDPFARATRARTPSSSFGRRTPDDSPRSSGSSFGKRTTAPRGSSDSDRRTPERTSGGSFGSRSSSSSHSSDNKSKDRDKKHG